MSASAKGSYRKNSASHSNLGSKRNQQQTQLTLQQRKKGNLLGMGLLQKSTGAMFTDNNSMLSLENEQRQNANNLISWNDLDKMREEDELEYLGGNSQKELKKRPPYSLSQEL